MVFQFNGMCVEGLPAPVDLNLRIGPTTLTYKWLLEKLEEKCKKFQEALRNGGVVVEVGFSVGGNFIREF
jgi:hypothetical protein